MCLSTKYKPKTHWKTETAILNDGIETTLVPVWKVLIPTYYSSLIVFHSPIQTSFSWSPGWNHSVDRYDDASQHRHKNVIVSGFHCYLRKKHAEDACQYMANKTCVVVKLYVHPDDVLSKGYSLRTKGATFIKGAHVTPFKKGWVVNNFKSLKDIQSKYVTYPTLVATRAYLTNKEIKKPQNKKTF